MLLLIFFLEQTAEVKRASFRCVSVTCGTGVRSMVDLDGPDDQRFPNWREASGCLARSPERDSSADQLFWFQGKDSKVLDSC